MKKAAFIFILFLLFPLILQASWRPGEMKIRIYQPSSSDIRTFSSQGYTIDKISPHFVDLLVIPAELEQLRRMGYSPEILIADLNSYSRELLESPELASYHDYYSTLALVDSLTAAYPDIIRKINYGFSISGRQLYAVKISDNVGLDEAEPEISFDGCHHGDEIMGSEIIILLMRDLCTGYGSDPLITDLVNTREIWIFPFINPDGRQTLSRYNALSVDINRDWGYMWDPDAQGNSPYPFSQPETRAAAEWILDNQFVISQTNHGGTELISHPWSYRPDLSPDHTFINTLAGGYASQSGYSSLPYAPGYNGLYPINGSAKDFFYGIMGSVGWTLEVSDNKTPPSSQIGLYYGYNKPAMLYLIEMANRGIAGQVVDSQSGAPLPATVWVSSGTEQYWPVYTDPVVGDFHKFVLPGTYTVRITANGYQTVEISGVAVSDTGATRLSVSLDPRVGTFGYRIITCQIPGNNFYDEGFTPSALGAPDGQSYSLGKGGWVVLDMGQVVTDYPGPDLKIYEGDGSPEGYSVSVSSQRFGTWTALGSAVGSFDFDISLAGLSEFRYVRIQDDGDGAQLGADAGFDLDAVEGRLIPSSGPYVLAESIAVVDTLTNSNGILESGEQAFLRLQMTNLGVDDASGVSVKIGSPSAYLTIFEDSVFVGDILAGNSVPAGLFAVSLDSLTPHLTRIDLSISISTQNGLNWMHSLPLITRQGATIYTQSQQLLFPETFINAESILPLTLRNTGADSLKISSISTSTPNFYANPIRLNIPPGGARQISVTFMPTDTLFYTDSLVIASNDPKQGLYKVGVSGRGIFAPDIAVSQDSISLTLSPTDSADILVTVQNLGAGTLSFEAQIGNYPGDGSVPAEGAGGSDAFGHVWVDSDEENGPVYDWIEIGDGSGIEIPISGLNAISEPIALNFAMPFYQNEYTSLRVSTNGWLSFTSLSVAYNNTNLPNILAPRDLIAPLWDNLYFQSDSKAYYRQDVNRFIVQWTRVYTPAGAGPYTFQAILYDTGNILFQYQFLSNLDSSYTVGIQNSEASDGFAIAYNQYYLHENLAILINHRNWVQVFPTSGTLEPGEQSELTLHFETENFPEADYLASLQITSNDPDEGVINLPILLSVSSAVSIQAARETQPRQFDLFQNFPNPFNPVTTIRFVIPEPGKVELLIYNTLGQEVKTLVQQNLTPGEYRVDWNGTNNLGFSVPSGIYFYELRYAGISEIKKMILIR